MIEAVVFDLDGVLIDSEPVWEEVRRELVAEHGGQWPPDAQHRLMGMSTPEWARYLTGELGVRLPPEQAAAVVIERMAARYSARLPLLPGAADAVRALSAQWPLGLASSSPPSLIDAVLDASSLRGCFRAAMSTEQVPAGKPAPDIYLAVAAALGCPARPVRRGRGFRQRPPVGRGRGPAGDRHPAPGVPARRRGAGVRHPGTGQPGRAHPGRGPRPGRLTGRQEETRCRPVTRPCPAWSAPGARRAMTPVASRAPAPAARRCWPATTPTGSAARSAAPDLAARAPDLWRYHEMLPVTGPGQVVSLGEGMTPLLPVPRLGRALGVPRLLMKDESLIPTGTFKARGAAVGVSRAAELGAAGVAMPTNGNAGAAWAAYAARAGLASLIVMPAAAPAINRAECAVAGAELYLVDGLIGDAAEIVAAALPGRPGYADVATLREPYRLEGKKTMGYEIAEQLGWRLPDVIVYPTGGGVGIIGIHKALDEMRELGWVTGPPPRLVAVQASGCAPIVRGLRQRGGAQRAVAGGGGAHRGVRYHGAAGARRFPGAAGGTRDGRDRGGRR